MADFHNSTLRQHERQESAEQAARDRAFLARLNRFQDNLDEFAEITAELVDAYRQPEDKWLSRHADQAADFARVLHKVWKDHKHGITQTDAERSLATLLEAMIRAECIDYADEEMERFL